jgi:type II secretory ATPase GspE/PulE/Tfp pilus assembly ATPase PilB-like protein
MSLQKKLGEGPQANPLTVRYPRSPSSSSHGAAPRTGQGDEAPIIELVDLIARSAVRAAASDIHIEPSERALLVRHRLDGLLKEVMDLPKWVHEGLIARVKIMAGLDIAERRLPQDGRIRLQMENGQPVDFRVSTLRTLHGEKIVLRLLDHQKGVPSLEQLGFSSTALEDLRQFLRFQHGMILVVGPTGSGKTTTLCSALTTLRSEKTNIVTIEDPIEYQLPGINQTQVSDKVKLTFASALRSILRQDPDVILVGEVRDQETARIAMQAAQTGHLVLTTLHTDDAPSAVTRLVDIGIEPYIVASATVGIVAQRLVRRLCSSCRSPCVLPPEVLRTLHVTDAVGLAFHRAVGCDLCHQTGYRGRLGIYEVMPVSDKLRRLIAQRASEATIRDAALSAGMRSLAEDGLEKVKAGITTAEELLRVVTEVGEGRTSCPFCRGVVAHDFVACPTCGGRLKNVCASCGRALHQEWTFCPYCARAGEASPQTDDK